MMEIDFDQVQLGLVVNLTILRAVLKSLSIDGRRWWLASDPQDALTRGSMTIGHGDPLCTDPLNTLYFSIPVIGNGTPRGGTDGLVLLFDQSTSCGRTGLLHREGSSGAGFVGGFLRFFRPIHRALITRLQEES
jgi:hypothetical protein